MSKSKTLLGGIYSTEKENFGTLTAVFPVTANWDGYMLHGYCRVTEEQAASFYKENPSASLGVRAPDGALSSEEATAFSAPITSACQKPK